MAEVKHLTDNNFKAEVLETQGPVLVDFWAPWCGPCRMMAPVIDAIATRFEGRLKVCKLNTDENPQTAAQFGILSIPTLIIFKEGKEQERLVGYLPESDLAARLTSLLD
ncbi:MAG: thioredoxin [candidate division WOR-3 bacterium]